jgi:hypothetical protein
MNLVKLTSDATPLIILLGCEYTIVPVAHETFEVLLQVPAAETVVEALAVLLLELASATDVSDTVALFVIVPGDPAVTDAWRPSTGTPAPTAA